GIGRNEACATLRCKSAKRKKPSNGCWPGPGSNSKRGGMNDDLEDGDRLFELSGRQLDETASEQAPSRLKAKLYTSLVQKQQESGRLLPLAETRVNGHGLCVFEDLWSRVTSAEGAQSFNCCSVCH